MKVTTETEYVSAERKQKTGRTFLISIQTGTTVCKAMTATALVMAAQLNAHDELVAALKIATIFLNDNYNDRDMPDILPICRAALARVQS